MKAQFISLLVLSFGLANCAVSPSLNVAQTSSSPHPSEVKYGVTTSPKVVADHENVPRGGGKYHVGKSYMIAGKMYHPFEKKLGHTETGMASWYGPGFHGRKTSNGEVFDMRGVSAAHRTMPLPSYARVTNQVNGHSIIVRVNDRGPFSHNRVLDLSSRAADLLDFKKTGHVRVKVEYVGRAPIAGSNDAQLAMTLRTNGQEAPSPLGAQSPVMVASTQPVALPAGSNEEEAKPLARKIQPLSPVVAAAEKKIMFKPLAEPENAKPKIATSQVQNANVALRGKPVPLKEPKQFSSGAVY